MVESPLNMDNDFQDLGGMFIPFARHNVIVTKLELPFFVEFAKLVSSQSSRGLRERINPS